MDDLISRQAAIDSLTEIIINLKNVYGDMGSAVNGARECIKSLSSAEPERKRGEWIYEGKRGRFPACKCSICGHYENADWAMLQGANFCPNCGADMREEYEDIPMEYFENGGI